MNIIRKIKGSHSKKDENFISAIKKVIGFKPRNISFYQKAFTHSSIKKRNEKGILISYERLEFLGDAILGSVIASYLFNKFQKEMKEISLRCGLKLLVGII